MRIVKSVRFTGSVRYGEFSQNIGIGTELDLDQVVGKVAAVDRGDGTEEPARDVTVGDLLEGRLDAFEPAGEAAAVQPDQTDGNDQDGDPARD